MFSLKLIFAISTKNKDDAQIAKGINNASKVILINFLLREIIDKCIEILV